MKLNVLLAKTDQLATYYKGMLKDYINFFSKKQGAFLGDKKTYEAKADMIDDPSKRGVVKVQTTVTEKLNYFVDNSKDYIDALFSQEATNASGIAKAELIVEGECWGELSSLELLRLKSIVEDKNLYDMIANIPVRSDAEQWELTNEEMYKDQEIYESPKIEGVVKTTEKETYIVEDPNIKLLKDTSNYVATTAIKNTIVEVGNYTYQRFSGELSQRERATMLKKRSTLLTAIIEALKNCNDVEIVESTVTADKIFSYLLEEYRI